jgi:hypothetical protein
VRLNSVLGYVLTIVKIGVFFNERWSLRVHCSEVWASICKIVDIKRISQKYRD